MHERCFLDGRDGSPSRPSARPALAPYQIIELRDLGSKSRCAEGEEQSRHHNENGKVRPVFEEIGPRKMIARMSAIKYVVGKSAPNA